MIRGRTCVFLGWVFLQTFLFHADAVMGGVGLPFERSLVLASSGSSIPLDLRIRSATHGPGRVYLQPVTQPGNETLRIRFRVTTHSPNESRWAIKVLAPSGELRWAVDSTSILEDEFWTDEIVGKRVMVELHSEVKDNPVEIVIDRLAYSHQPAIPESITDPNGLAPIGVFSEPIRNLGISVSKLKFIGDDGPIYNCTGFLIGADLLLTNQHCISSESERRSAIVLFDYDSKISETTVVRLKAIVISSHELDYSLVQLDRQMTRLPLELDNGPVEAGTDLIVIQHPGGEPKQVSIQDCAVADSSVVGRGEAETDFSHTCDTLGGSSGSPVFSAASLKVIGLHHLGFEESDLVLKNRAVRMDQVAATFAAGLMEVEATNESGSPPQQ